MNRLIILIVTTFLITNCKSPEDTMATNASTIIKGLIENPDSYKYKGMEFMDESTYGASVKFWENFFRQNYVKGENTQFEKDIADVKEKFKNRMDQTCVQKYKFLYNETDAAGKILDKSRVLYFDENQEQVKGMVYIYGIDAFEFEGLDKFKKYGEIN